MKLNPERASRYYYLKFSRLKGHPRVLARGIAVGTFIGITPTIPFHVIMAIFFSILFRGSKIAAILTTFIVSNPITFLPQYYFSWKVGNWISPGNHSWNEVSSLLETILSGGNFSETVSALAGIGINSLFRLVGGGIILAIPFTILFYFSSYLLFRHLQKKRLEKQILD